MLWNISFPVWRFPAFYELYQKKKKKWQLWWQPLVNTSLFFQFWENITSFNFLANTLLRPWCSWILSHTMFIYIIAQMLRKFHFSLRTRLFIWGELPSGPRHCNQNQKVPSSIPTGQVLGPSLVMTLLVSEISPSINGPPLPPWKSKLHLAHLCRSWKNNVESRKLKSFIFIPDI